MASVHGMHRLGRDSGESGGRGGLGCGLWIHWSTLGVLMEMGAVRVEYLIIIFRKSY